MKDNKLLKLLLVSVVLGLGACSNSKTSSNVVNNNSSLSNEVNIKKYYTVTWVLDGNSFEEKYLEGETPVYKFGTTKESDKTYTYTFSGWDKLIKPVTEDITYTAQYIKEYIDYTYTWVIDGEEVIETYHYGDEATYKGETPFKEGDEKYTYTFTGWNKEVDTVTNDETIVAQFEKSVRQYTVTFNIEGKTVEELYYYGELPDYDMTPTKEADDTYTYVFTGWDKSIGPVTEDITYTAVFEAKPIQYFDVKFYDFLGNLLYSASVKEGTVPTYVGNLPTIKDSNNNTYDFIGWLNRDTGETYINELAPLTGDTNYYAYSNEIGMLTVNLYDNGQKSVYTQEVLNNVSYLYNIPSKTGYVPTLDYVKGIMNISSTFNVYYTEFDTWDGTSISNSYSGGTGTLEDPYLISSAADLAYLRQQVANGNTYLEKYFKMTKSLDMSNSNFMIGDFAGHFDGNYCSIRGLNISSTTSCGLFKTLLTNGSINNVTTYGNILSTASKTGSIVGESHGLISNCTNYATVKANGQRGGIVGYSYTPIINCVNNGDVLTNSSGWNVGGIVGQTIDNVINCTNNGKVEGATCVGGIVGETADGIVVSIEDCENSGTIESTSWGVGGIVGNIYGCSLADNTNFGKVIGVGQIGGIAGKGKGTISSCYNYGSIDSQNTGGGIAGEITGGYLLDCKNYGSAYGHTGTITAGIAGKFKGQKLENCTNYGAITGNDRTAGLVGYFYGLEMNNCKNYGIITGTNTSGGIIGQIWTNENRATVTNCDNHGTVNVSSWNTGGLFGTADICDITKCTNYADVINTGDATGGIAGAIYEGAVIDDCHNKGNLTAKNNVGGLLFTNRGTIKNCTNSGNITITTSTGSGNGTIFTDTSGNSENCTNTGQIIKA